MFSEKNNREKYTMLLSLDYVSDLLSPSKIIASSTNVGHVIVGMAVCRTGVFALAVVGAL